MIQFTRILFLIFLTSLISSTVSAHQEHFNKKYENIESSGIPSATIKSDINRDIKVNKCGLIDLTELDCCCCISGMCFQFDKKNSCGTDNISHQILCRSHCEDARSNDNNSINQNVKSSTTYKINFPYNFSANKETKALNPNSSQNSIIQITPAYISTHSFLI